MLQGNASSIDAYLLTPANLFLLFFMVFGPGKLLVPFHLATQEMDTSSLRATAIKVTAISSITLTIAGLLGGTMMEQWRISVPVMQLAGGLILLLVALKLVLAQYADQHPPPTVSVESGVMRLIFPGIVTPLGSPRSSL